MSTLPFHATDCIAAFTDGDITAREIAEGTLARIAAINPGLNAYTSITEERALAEADALDAARAHGTIPGLAAVPYAVKNLFDIKGQTTLAGAHINAHHPPALTDATLVRRLGAAGAMLTGALNMDALAYGFTTENTHYGATHNPRDTTRTAGGSSGGSGAAVAAGLVPIALASDTNGSIRVPASLCGVFGLKPTYGRLSRSGSFPFVASLDHLGPLAASVTDLALAYDVLQGADASDPACAQREREPAMTTLGLGIDGLRIARLGAYFDDNAGSTAQWAAKRIADSLGAREVVELPGTAIARAAAFVMTATEGGALHLDVLRTNLEDFEPLSRARLIAGSLVPATWHQKAQRYRSWYYQQVQTLFKHFDLLIAPATPVSATRLGQENFDLAGRSLLTRPNMGLLTQPISFIGLPVVVVPLWPEGGLPIGVQLIAPAWREDLCLRTARVLEQMGIVSARVAGGKV